MKTSRGPCLVFRNRDEVCEVVGYGLSCQRRLTSPKEQAEKHFHHPERGEDHCQFLEVQFCYCVQVSRQTGAVVEIVGREVVRELRKNSFSIILETKDRLETGR